nr:hypothetical protein [Streptomyces triticisoli]
MAAGVPAATTGLDPAKKVPGRTRGPAVDVRGLVIAVTVPAADIYDDAAGIALLDGAAAHTGNTAGKALVGRDLQNQVALHGVGLDIGVETVERNPQDTGFVPQPKRWRVEQTSGILIPHRRLVRAYEHHPGLLRLPCPLGDDPRQGPPAHRYAHCHPARGAGGACVTIQPLREALDVQKDAARTLADDLRTQITEVQGRLREAETHLEHLVITRKTVTALADRLPARPASPDLPDHPDHPRILAAFHQATGPLSGPRRPRSPRPRTAAEEHRGPPRQAETPGQTRHAHRDRHRQLRPATAAGQGPRPAALPQPHPKRDINS